MQGESKFPAVQAGFILDWPSTHLALKDATNAGVALGQEGAGVQHARGLGEGAEVDGDRNASLLLQPLAGFLKQARIACTAVDTDQCMQ